MSEMKDPKETLSLSRRKFMTGAGTFLAGAAVTAAGCSALISRREKTAEASAAAATWPLPYTILDVEDIRARGHAGYYKGQ